MADSPIVVDRFQLRRSDTPGYRPPINGLRALREGEAFFNTADSILCIGTGLGPFVEFNLNLGGPRGPEGPEGPVGPIGPRGFDGPAGPTGSPGVAGSSGAKGDKGDSGQTGAQGAPGPKGDQGIQGLAGPQGAQGERGLQGLQGDAGPQGAQGPKGDQGAGVTIKGSRTSPSALPTTGNAMGDLYIMSTAGSGYADGDGYAYTGSGTDAGPGGNWKNVGPVRGPRGEQGLPGATGPKGDAGADGAQGPQGVQGQQGPQGARGDQGIQGVAGSKGDVGATGAQGPQGNPTTVNGKTGTSITLSAADVGAPAKTGDTYTGQHFVPLAARRATNSDITQRVEGGVYEGVDTEVSLAKGWPFAATYGHLIAATHSNQGNYFSFQLCTDFYNNAEFYVRATNNVGNQTWRRLWHDANFDALIPPDTDVAPGFSTTKRPTVAQVSALVARINPLLRYGFVGDGVSRPISGVTRFNGVNTTGFTLALWQSLVPEIGALTDEIDGVAIQAALNAQMTRDFVTVIELPPASRARVSRTINASGNVVLTGQQAWLESVSPAADPIIRHGTASAPSSGEMHLEGLRFACNSRRAVYAYFHPAAGAAGEGRSFYMRACTFKGAPADAVLLVNAPRTIHVSCNSFWTPGTYVVGAAFRAVAEPYATGTVGNASAPQNSGSFCFTLLDNLTSGFQYGFQFDIAPNNGAASGVIEGVLLYGCHSYNGQTMLKVTNARNSGGTFSYGTPLWVIRDCDYEGFGAFAEMSGVAEVTFDSNWLIINQGLCGGPNQPATPAQVNFFDLDYTLGATITNNTIGINQLKTPTVRCLDTDAYSSNTLFRDNLIANVGTFDCIAHYAAVANGLNAYTHMEWNTRFIYTDQPKPTVLVRDDGNNQYSQSRVAAYAGASMLPDGQIVYQAAPTCTVQANMNVTVPIPAGLFREVPRLASCTTANYGQFPYRVEGVRNDFATTTQGIAVMQTGTPTTVNALLLYATFRGR